MSDDQSKNYNTVYEKVVRRDDDLVGLIAYALYKQNKRDWLIQQRQRKGKDPTETELGAYLTAQQLDRTIQMYRDQAEAVLKDFGEQVIERATPELQQAAISGKIEETLRWYKQLPTGIAAAFIYTVILILIALVLRYAGIDFLSIISSSR